MNPKFFMDSERWQQVDQLFHSALERDPGAREEFLSQSCAGDDALRREVEALIKWHEQSGTFIETPAADIAAELLSVTESHLRPGLSIGFYEIVSLLGVGGMGEVYLAEDARLGRQVALKRLAPRFTLDVERVRRFEQEARAASALNHPNIVTVYEIGRLNSLHFITTEFIDGETLQHDLARARRTLDEAIDIAIQVTSALSAAHVAGIVHRDVKPENIMLRRDGIVKVLDFGLAKLAFQVPLAGTKQGDKSTVKTNPGMVMGTLHYMSPEQARGQEVDARTDIWSLGVVLYEMLTGRAPFEGETPSHVMVSIMENEPPSLSRYSDGSDELERIVNKALRKNKDERYRTAGDFLLDLKNLKQELELTRLKQSLQADADSIQTTRPMETADAPQTSYIHRAGYLVNTIRRHKRMGSLVAVAAVMAFLATTYFYSGAKSYPGADEVIDSIAVLPFFNSSGDPNSEYLSDGLSDSIINNLARWPTLRVMSFNSVLRYKGKQTDAQAVGRELNVRAVLISRFVQQQGNLTISTELVSVRDNRRLWGEQYSRTVSDILGVQDEIAQEISRKLGLRLDQETKPLAKRYTESSAAYQLYLLGQYHLRKLSKEGFAKGLAYFEQAINKDSTYALAYVGVANIYLTLGYRGLMSPNEAQQKAESATRRALLLDETLAEAHVSLGHIKEGDWDWPAAEKEFKRALELNPGSAEANRWYGLYLRDVGRPNEALAWANRAYEMDGPSPTSLANLGASYDSAGQYDQAIDRFLKAIELDANYAPAHAQLGRSYLIRGGYEEAIRELQKAKSFEDSPERQGRFAWLAFAYAASGRTDEARRMLDQLQGIAKQRYIPPYIFALIYTGLDDKDQAFVFLEKAYDEHSQQLASLKSEPLLNSLRSDPRFTDLLRRVHLAP